MRSVIPLFTGRRIMMMNKIMLRWTFIVLAIAAPLLYAWYIHYQRNHFSCEAHVTVVDDNYLLDVMMDYSFMNGEGSYATSGKYTQKGQPPVEVSNKIAFNYWREAGDIIMVSSDTSGRPKRNEAFRLDVPDFFRLRDRGLKVQITPANASSYFIIYRNAPVIYCAKE